MFHAAEYEVSLGFYLQLFITRVLFSFLSSFFFQRIFCLLFKIIMLASTFINCIAIVSTFIAFNPVLGAPSGVINARRSEHTFQIVQTAADCSTSLTPFSAGNNRISKRDVALDAATSTIQQATTYEVCLLSYQSKIAAFTLG